MKLVAEPSVRDHIEAHGGRVYVWPHRYRCCRSSTWVLEAATEPPDRAFELVHAVDGFQLHATPGLVEPDELHLELDSRARSGPTGTARAGSDEQSAQIGRNSSATDLERAGPIP